MGKVIDYFKKFYNMKPYLQIEEEEWQHIINTYEKEDVVEALAECLHTYPCPIPEITEEDTLKSLNKLKSIQWPDVFVPDSWFPRNERKSKWSLSDEYIKPCDLI